MDTQVATKIKTLMYLLHNDIAVPIDFQAELVSLGIDVEAIVNPRRTNVDNEEKGEKLI
jgi:hypothetical protein